jgi:prevent-host-death family protein
LALNIDIKVKNTYFTCMPMRLFSSLDLQQQSGEIQRAAAQAPVVITSHGKPRAVVMSVEEFRRLKTEAREEVPVEAIARQPTVFGPDPDDVLGYPERDPVEAVHHMAKDAVAGINQDLVRQEADRFAKHFVRGAK